MKMLCETVGSIQLIDVYNGGQKVSALRPSVVEPTEFIRWRASLNQVRFLGEVTDEATDAEFAKFWAESDQEADLAVSSFLSAYGIERPSEKKPAKAQKKSVEAVTETEIAATPKE